MIHSGKRFWTQILISVFMTLTGLFAPTLALADTPAPEPTSEVSTRSGLVQCGVGRDCTICDIFILIRNIFNFILQMLGMVGVLSIVIGGVYMMLASGNPGMYQQGLQIIQHAITGLVLAASSFLIFGFGLQALGFQEQNFTSVFSFESGSFFEIQCDNAAAFNDRGGWGTGVSSPGSSARGNVPIGSLDVPCLVNTSITPETAAVIRTINVYEHGGGNIEDYYTLVGGQKYPESHKYHPRVIGIMNSTAYGRYQMIDSTWDGWAAAAGVPKDIVPDSNAPIRGGGRRLNPEYNMSPEYQDLAVAKFLERESIATCDSFAASGNRSNGPRYLKACQWTSIPGCGTQPNPTTQKYPSAADLCRTLLADETSGACQR